MAEILGLAASIAGLLKLATDVSSLLNALRGSITDAPTELRSIGDEIDSMVTVLHELQLCFSAQSLNGSFQQALQRLDLERTVQRISLELNTLHAAFKRAGSPAQKGWKKRWTGLQYLIDEKQIQRRLGRLQRQKLALLLALSCFTL